MLKTLVPSAQSSPPPPPPPPNTLHAAISQAALLEKESPCWCIPMPNTLQAAVPQAIFFTVLAPDHAPTPDACRLWSHEMLRVFHDRLVSGEDRAWFCRFMSDMVEQHLGLQLDQVAQVPADVDPSEVREVAALRNIMYCSFLTQVGGNSKLQQHG